MMIKGGIRIGGLGISGYDADAAAYFERAGVTDATAKNQINAFVIGVKDLGLWSNMACWPSRSAQNAGTGNTVYSLGGLGTFNATKTAGITWNANGLRATTASQYANFSNPFDATTLNGVSTWSVVNIESINSTGWFNGFINIRSSFATNYIYGFCNTLYADITSNNPGGGSTDCFPTAGYFRRDYAIGAGGFIGNGFHSQLTSTQANPNLCVMYYDSGFQGTLQDIRAGTTFVNNGSNNFFMSSTDLSSNFTTSMYGAFYATFNSYVASNSAALYTLYKTTMGTGLGLP